MTDDERFLVAPPEDALTMDHLRALLTPPSRPDWMTDELYETSTDPKWAFCDVLKDERDGETYAYFIRRDVAFYMWRPK